MPEIELKYGCNPHQGHARVSVAKGDLPLKVLNGRPSYINILDALTAWPLVRELSAVTAKTAAASFKHASPAGAAVEGPVSADFANAQFLDGLPFGAAARAYVRARGADRMSSFGDAVAVSGSVDLELAEILRREVSDLIIAPSFDKQALDVLSAKKNGSYLILQIDPSFEPQAIESRQIFGMTLEQERNRVPITRQLFETHPGLPETVVETFLVATVALKYTQSNSVCLAHDGQVIGMGAGQQSRIHCTRIACAKAEKWMLQTHPKVLSLRFPPGLARPEKTNAVDCYLLWEALSATERAGLVSTLGYDPDPLTPSERQGWIGKFADVCLSSDAFIPFSDNIDRAAMSGVAYVAHPGGSVRDDLVRSAAAELGITVVETGVRCFLH